MFKSIIFILIFVCCVCLSSAQYQRCTTADQRIGACLEARECPSAVSQFRRDHECGGHGFGAVCCPFESATNSHAQPSNNHGSFNSDRPSSNHHQNINNHPSSNHHHHHNNHHQSMNDRPSNNQESSNIFGQSFDERPSNNNHHSSSEHRPANEQQHGGFGGGGGILSSILGNLFNTNDPFNNNRPIGNQQQTNNRPIGNQQQTNNFGQSANDRPYNFRPSTIGSRPNNEPSNNRPTSQAGSRFQSRDLPQPGQCGTHLADRIIGGSATQITEFPWMALLEYTSRRGKGYYCGGSLINENYVLTAAHCLGDSELTGVRLGEWNLKTSRDCEEDVCSDPVVDVPVAEQIVHENYGGEANNHQNDIALLRLARPVRFTDWVKPICLPVSQNIRSRSYDSYPFIVAGWGKTERRSSSDVKKKVQLDGVSLRQCRQVYAATNTPLTESQLCAGGVKNEDSCSGDSGGPLMAVDSSSPTNNYYIAGIVSFGTDPCAQQNKPGVYTKVDQYTDWIIEHMRH